MSIIGETGYKGRWEIAVLSFQFFCKFKTALRKSIKQKVQVLSYVTGCGAQEAARVQIIPVSQYLKITD